MEALFRRLVQSGLIGQVVEGSRGGRVRVGGRWLLNFAAANALGLNGHPAAARLAGAVAQAWGAALGMPRWLAVDSLTPRLERALAQLTGQERALVFPSTTHAALDVLPALAGAQGTILLDEWAYPISREAAGAAARHGARLLEFRHDDPRSLKQALRARGPVGPGRGCVIVVDGVYAAGGRPADLGAIARLAGEWGAVVYVDDAHGIGVLGEAPDAFPPYGRGGGGTPRFFGLPPGNLVHVGSLSKAFGAPLAFAAGPARLLDPLGRSAAAFIHSSPPALPTLAAGLAALAVHDREGEARRLRLARRVARFRAGVASLGLCNPPNRLFPIQTLYFAQPQAALQTAAELRRRGLLSVPQLDPPDSPSGGALRFLISAAHREEEIDEALALIAHGMKKGIGVGLTPIPYSPIPLPCACA